MKYRLVRHKYNATPTKINGIHFDSRKEAKYYTELIIRRDQLKEVVFFLRQVPFHLPGKVKYVVDFQEFHADGTVHFIDVKGMKTKEFIMKKKMVEELYPIEIEIV